MELSPLSGWSHTYAISSVLLLGEGPIFPSGLGRRGRASLPLAAIKPRFGGAFASLVADNGGDRDQPPPRVGDGDSVPRLSRCRKASTAGLPIAPWPWSP